MKLIIKSNVALQFSSLMMLLSRLSRRNLCSELCSQRSAAVRGEVAGGEARGNSLSASLSLERARGRELRQENTTVLCTYLLLLRATHRIPGRPGWEIELSACLTLPHARESLLLTRQLEILAGAQVFFRLSPVFSQDVCLLTRTRIVANSILRCICRCHLKAEKKSCIS
jgi:hypothetical protein